MRIRDNDRAARLLRSAKAWHGAPFAIIQLGKGLAELWHLDGNVLVKPASGGLLLTKWDKFHRYIRRHKLMA